MLKGYRSYGFSTIHLEIQSNNVVYVTHSLKTRNRRVSTEVLKFSGLPALPRVALCVNTKIFDLKL